ncbi:MAG: BREX system ATP-binding domain-containing protein [Bacillota bacterium]
MPRSLVEFFREEYLKGFIRAGGSKIKLYTSESRERRAALLQELAREAVACGYAAALVDGATVARVHLFSNLYQAVTAELDIAGFIQRYTGQVVKALGYDPGEVTPGMTFVDWAAEVHERIPERLRREVQERLERDLFRNKSIYRGFATVAVQLAADVLGATERKLTPQDRELLYSWLRGESVLLRDLKRFHVFTRVDRYNARLFLRSLVELARLAGYHGLFVAVDNLDVLLARRETGRPLYSRTARDEFYESVRQLIDEIDTLHHLIIILGFNRDLAEHPTFGIKSYIALWLRIQCEIEGKRVNLFRDFLDLDRLPAEPGTLSPMPSGGSQVAGV